MAKKETVKSFVLRVDAETMEAIEKWAADEFRSTNGQLQWINSGGIAEKRKDEKEENCCKRKGDNRIIIKKYSYLHRVFEG